MFLCLTLWPIWSERFPPMQDYPQHLAQAQIIRAYDNPAFDYNQNFVFHLRPFYAAFFLATLFFSTVAPIEVAGKLALSLYPVLIALVVYRLGKRRGERGSPWGALLLFPMAFNQQYFMGNTNYMLSLPVLVLALMDFEDLLAGPLRAWPVLRQFLWQVALFTTHPFSFLVYCCLALAGALLARDKKADWMRKALLAAAGALLLFAAARIESASASVAKDPAAGEVVWMPLSWMLKFFAVMFNGMQWTRGAQPVPLVLWAGVFAVVLGAWIARRKVSGPFLRLRAIVLVPVILAFFVLPFRIGTFAYINARVAAIVYFLLALLAAEVEIKGWWKPALVTLLALALVDSIARQASVSAEIAEIVPAVERIPPNSRILPLVFDQSSAGLEPMFFGVHLHDAAYYHVLVGGGFNPYFFESPGDPVHYRKGAERPAPPEPDPWSFTWEEDSADYQYFLVRSAPEAFQRYIAPRCDEAAASGKWTLYERRR
jgi:hypothetical protein